MLVEAVITISSSPKFGDYQCNSAMQIAQHLKQLSVKSSPREVAQKLVAELQKPIPCVDRLEIAGAGYVNIFLSRYAFSLIVYPQYFDNSIVSFTADLMENNAL